MAAGLFSEIFSHVGQWRTHVDPPAHFVRGGKTVDQNTLKEMILPLVVINVHDEVASDADYTLTLERQQKWETKHGQIPAGAFVDMRTVVKALARRRENAEQRQYRGGSLSGMEHAGARRLTRIQGSQRRKMIIR